MVRVSTLVCAVALSTTSFATEVQIPFEGITLNGDLTLAEDKSLSDGVLILTHGTLAHNKMELIDTLQTLLVDYGISTLSINLSLGIDNRESAMYDCAIPASHKQEDALAEIDAWQNWLDEQGAGPRLVMGHSRGGNQTAQYTLAHPDRVDAQILLAPATWSYESSIAGYKTNYGQDIEQILANSESMNDDAIIDGASILYCEGSGAQVGSLRSYYANNPNYDTPTVLSQTDTPTLVLAGSLDTVVADLPERMGDLNKDNVEFIIIEDADHFFLDLFADEVVDYALEFIEAR